jgi:hypothetical protein
MSEAEPGAGVANPYAAPRANVAQPAPAGAGALIENGQRVGVGRGVAWIAEGFALFRKSPGTWIGTMLLFIFGSMIFAMIPIIGSLGINLLMPVFIAGFMIGCHALEEGEPLQVAHLFAGFKKNVGQLILVGLLYMIGAVVLGIAIAVIGGLGAFAAAASGISDMGPLAYGAIAILVLVGIGLTLPLVMAYWFAPALVVFHDLDAMQAMKQSFYGCLKNFLPYLVYGVVAFLLVLPISLPMILGVVLLFANLANTPVPPGLNTIILVSLPLTLGWLVLWPTMIAAMYASYRDIYAPYPGTE